MSEFVQFEKCPQCGDMSLDEDGCCVACRFPPNATSPTQPVPVPGSPVSTSNARWQPIESAPKDGTEILGWFPSLSDQPGGCEVTWFQAGEDFKMLLPEDGFSPRFTTSAADCSNGEHGWWAEGALVQPTHWMPLPDAPAATLQEDTGDLSAAVPCLDQSKDSVSLEEERVKFEAWLTPQGECDFTRKRFKPDQYQVLEFQMMFEAWLARAECSNKVYDKEGK